MAGYEFIKYEQDGNIVTITINRPERMNSIHPPTTEELSDAWDTFAADDSAWVGILTGAGERAFSAGNDLKYTAEMSRVPANERPTFAPVQGGFGGITADWECPKPMIAAVNGFALGGGCEMAMACDIIIAADHARLGLPEPRVGLMAGAVGGYTGVVLSYPAIIHIMLSPAVGAAVAVAAVYVSWWSVQSVFPNARLGLFAALASIPAAALGAWCGYLVANAPGAGLYLSWAVSCLLAGAVGLALYRGLYVYMRQRARSPLIMLVASLGVLLAIAAFIVIVFESAPRPLPNAFGSETWKIAGARIKGFNVFGIGVALAGFAVLWLMLRQTSFGRAVRAIGDDEEVSKVVGINTTVIIAAVFFIGSMYAALGGILNGHDTAVQPRMGLLLLLKGWIASVVGGIGNLYGAIVGGFILGIVEQFGIWDLAGEWKDAIAFILLILFLSFWPQGLLPRR